MVAVIPYPVILKLSELVQAGLATADMDHLAVAQRCLEIVGAVAVIAVVHVFPSYCSQ